MSMLALKSANGAFYCRTSNVRRLDETGKDAAGRRHIYVWLRGVRWLMKDLVFASIRVERTVGDKISAATVLIVVPKNFAGVLIDVSRRYYEAGAQRDRHVVAWKGNEVDVEAMTVLSPIVGVDDDVITRVAELFGLENDPEMVVFQRMFGICRPRSENGLPANRRAS